MIFNWCSHIVVHACDDQSSKTITEDLQMLMSTICSTISCHKVCYDSKSLHWSSCSNIVSDSLCHCLLHEVCVNFKIQYRNLWLNLDLHEKTVFKFSLYHILKNESITNWLIKHVWKHFKEWIHKHYSELETLISSDKMIKKHMIEILQEIWTALNDEFLKKLIKLIKD